MSFELVVGAVALLGGVTAAVSGAGIGSMLVPLFALPEKAFGRVVSFIVLVLAILSLVRPPSQ